jgi:hypothetical protein
LGVKGLGGVLSIRLRTSSSLGALGMDETPKTPGRPYGSGSYGSGPYGVYTIPASETEEGKERIRSYYESLGRFIGAFSEAETAVHLTLRAYAGTPAEIANIAFSGVKMKNGMVFIKQIAKATEKSQWAQDDLKDIFDQLSIINGVRNDILHHGANMVAEGKGYVSNALRAKGEATEFPISPELLNAMWQDLQRILVRLYYDHLGRPRPISTLALLYLNGLVERPWQYKYQTLKPSNSTPEAPQQPEVRDQAPLDPPPTSRG